jgi:hypothetical protein
MTRMRWPVLLLIAPLAACTPTTVRIQPEDLGIGFVLKSSDFANPCTSDPGDYPVIYVNHSVHAVDVSFKLVNTGGSNVFVESPDLTVGIVLPPPGPNTRPHLFRATLSPGGFIKLHGQAADCAWTATILPH